ncbi:MAG: hypothetical protein Q3965_02380 [Rothia sp. (in: high G+C Gram-positive bacteria)]|nr:hypothetical protein [Rothia sp. (in: high G+C Gram-positive bacteria)]
MTTTTADSILTIRIPSTLKERLTNLATTSDRSVAYCARNLIEEHIAEAEYAAELHAKVKAIKSGERRAYTADEVRKELGL